MTAYYNEWDKYAARVLEARIAEGRLPAGDVDTRSIKEVMPDDLKGYSEVHLFAGIGGWPLALDYARWSGPVWTGSCPCQPFSAAGKGKGEEDERHLWPEFRRLISACNPSIVFGEQVASKSGRQWLSQVRFDLEHIRYWGAYHESLHKMLAAKTPHGLSELLGKVAGRVETTVQRMPEGLRGRVAEDKQTKTGPASRSAGAQGENIPTKIRCAESRAFTRDGGGEAIKTEGTGLRSEAASAGDRGENSEGSLRTDGSSVRLSRTHSRLEQPISASHRAEAGIHLPQHPSSVLWDECGLGELGGTGATTDARRLVTKEHLDDERKIASVFGKIIEASVKRLRISGVRFDLETLGYAVGAADLCAAGAGAPHIRQRLWWVADSESQRQHRGQGATGEAGRRGIKDDGSDGGLADSDRKRQLRQHALLQRLPFERNETDCAKAAGGSQDGGLEHPQGDGRQPRRAEPSGRSIASGRGDSGLEHAEGQQVGLSGCSREPGGAGFWSDYDLIPCADGKARRVESGTFPLAFGVPNRVGKLRCYGNAIEIHIAGEFIAAYKDTLRGD